MGLTQVSTDGVKNDAINTAKINNGSIQSEDIADNQIITTKILDGAVSLAKLPHGDTNNNGKFLRANNGADPSFETVSIPAGTTINNNANNRVITGSGTANTLEGESTLTFDDTNDVLTAGGGLGIQNVSGILAGNGGGQDYLGLKDSGNNFAFMVKTHGTNNGFVGIGETAPLAQLHIKPASNVKQLLLEQNNATDGYALFQDGPNGGHLKFMRHINGSDTQTLLLRSGGGLCFGTDNAAANALDDYEEGTWSPQIYYQNSGDQSDSANLASYGWYQKVGNVVHISFFLRWSLGGSAANDNIGVKNMPFAFNNITSTYGDVSSVGSLQHSGTSLNNSDCFVLKGSGNGDTKMYMEDIRAEGNRGDEFGANNGMRVWGTFTYRTT